MEYKDTPAQAAEYLRKAVPLMVKHSVAPNPCNYALWYSYVSSKNEQLKRDLDTTIEQWGTCPSVAGNALFRKHIIMDELGDNEEIRNSLSGIVNELQEQVGQTLEGTQNFSAMLDNYSDSLRGEQLEGLSVDLPCLLKVIEDLTRGTEQVSNTTRSFQMQLELAQNEIKHLKEELAQSQLDATLDPLTGLYNRRLFDSVLEEVVKSKGTHMVCVVFMDVDNFKAVNDNYGHPMGDRVLQFLAQLLLDDETPGTAVRYGGEEFAILLRDFDLYSALDIAEMLRSKIEHLHIKDKKSGKVINNITASFGVAQFRPNETPELFIERTDAALYKAKQAGKNCCQLAL